MADNAHRATDKRLVEMEKKLSAMYSEAAESIERKWQDYLKKVEPKIAEAQKIYDDAKKSGDEARIRETGKALSQLKRRKIIFDKRYKALVEQTATQLANVNEIALAYINGELPKVYIQHFVETSEGIKSSVAGYSFALVDQDTVKRIITDGDKSLLPPPSRKTLDKIEKALAEGKDIRWNTEKINSQVLQGILQGDSIPKIAKRMRNVTDMNLASAVRNSRTMVTGAENAGRMDMLRQANKDGIMSQKKWMAAHDERTREWHAALDGELKDVDEPFENAYGEIMFPGDPSAHPANVYNCRCTLGYEVKGFK